VTKNVPSTHHIITANEGAAIGLACGSYMASGQPALVYLQVSQNLLDKNKYQFCFYLEFRFG
jgi:hypothetical protein